MVIAAVAENGAALARILAIDQGEGIANIAEAMSDGFSTAGTMDGGLGAMKRLATKLDIFTGRGRTIVLLELGTSAPKLPLQISGSPCLIQANASVAMHGPATRHGSV
jgi:hypothetical protein